MDLTRLTEVLKTVAKPSQYLGNEVNAVRKDFAAQKLRVALVFPDKYEIGMSHMGLKILYDILNNIEGVVAERCFAPSPDFEAALRGNGLKLYGLESKTPLCEFDVIGISLPYELTYTNLVNVLDLAGIPVWQKDRGENHPIVLAGGTGAYNPEPVADFLDAVALGDAEELILEFVSKMLAWKERRGIDLMSENAVPGGRAELLDDLRNVEGIYVPSFFEPSYKDDGTLAEIRPLKPDYVSVRKRVAADLDAQPYPVKLVLPNIRLVHDRIGIEIQRGCTRMCRFCQAGYIERPTRQRSPERVLDIAEKSYAATGIDEISLLSLSAGDYQTIVPTLKELNRVYSDKKVSISVPATRTETLTPELIEQVKKVRRTGFTIAPEAGSERMRRVINKGNKTEDLLKACHNAFSAGYRLIKFYYLVGLPFERDEDVAGIADEAGRALDTGLSRSRDVEINVSVSTLVPKPFTPFQWGAQMTVEETHRKHELIKRRLKDKRLRFKCHDPRMSFLEGIFARGDRRLSRVIYRAFANGCRFDEWSEHLDFALWEKTFAETGLEPAFYLHRERGRDEVLPWDHLFSQMRKEWLWDEFAAAEKEAFAADCSVGKCAQFCGACDFKTVKNRIYVVDEKPVAAKKGNREWYGRFGAAASEPLPAASDGKPGTGSGEPILQALQDRVKLRVHYAKTGMAALIGHSELLSHLRRAVLRTGAPAAYSQGFHPQMKLSMGYPLPFGMESECESFDLVLLRPVDTERFLSDLNAALPQGIAARSVESIDLKAPSLYSQTESIRYRVRLPDAWWARNEMTFKANLDGLRNGREMTFARKRSGEREERVFEISRHVRLADAPFKDGIFEFASLCHPEGSMKPSEVVQALSGETDAGLAGFQVTKVGVQYRT